MKNLLYITPRLDGSGGLSKVISVKTSYLVEKAGYNITVLVTNAHSDSYLFDFSKITVVNRKIKGKGPLYLSNYVKIVKDQIKKQKPDIVIIVDNGLKGHLLPFFLKNKIVFEQHGYRHYAHTTSPVSFIGRIKQRFLDVLTDKALAKVDKFVVLTTESKKEWKSKNIEAIANPLWFEPYHNNSLTEKKVIAVGRQVYEKGFDMLLHIWKEVISEHSDWTLEIYGDPDESLGLEELAAQLDLTENVTFHPPVLNIIEKYKAASILLMTSRHEGFGMVLIEAMACGLPCVAFDCPTGPSEIITDGENGYLIPPFDVSNYADRVKDLIREETLRKKMGANAVQSVHRFELNKIMKKWEELFSSL